MLLKLTLPIAVIFSAACSYWVTDKSWQTRWDAHMLQDAKESIAALKSIRDRETRIAELQTEAENNAKKLQAEYAASIAAAADVNERLQHALNQRMSRPAATGACTIAERATAATDKLVLADLFRRADSRAGALAEYADRARSAGLICEQKYNALITRF